MCNYIYKKRVKTTSLELRFAIIKREKFRFDKYFSPEFSFLQIGKIEIGFAFVDFNPGRTHRIWKRLWKWGGETKIGLYLYRRQLQKIL